MKEYHKIDSLFERDRGTKKLLVGQFKDPTIEYLKDCVWQFTEKVDGTNIRIFWDGHRVSFGGRTDKAELPQHLVARLEQLFSGETNEEVFEQLFGEKEAILFGEGYGVKIQNGNLYRDDVDFILFDVMIGENFQPREVVEDIAKYFNLEVVPIVLEGTLQDGIEYVKTHKQSVIAKNGAELEGVVGRTKIETCDRTGKRNIVKIKARDYE